MTAVWQRSTAKGNDRLVLLSIADHAHDDGTGAWPSQRLLMHKTLLSERTIRRCIDNLCDMQELAVERVGRRLTYRVLLGGLDGIPANLTGIVSGQSDRSKAANLTADQSTHTEPLREPKAGTVNPDADRLCDLLADLIEANGSKRPTVTKVWRREADRLLRIDRRPVAEAEALIRWAQQDQFWQSNVLSMPKFRVQYDKLRLQSRRRPGGRGNVVDLSGRIQEARQREAGS